jgi:hypothetical protein
MADRREFLLQCIRDRHPVLDALVAFYRDYPAFVQPWAVSETASALLPLFVADAAGRGRMAARLPLLWTDRGALNAQDKNAASRPPSWWELDLRKPRHRLALVKPPILNRLALWCGLAAHRKEIARRISRDDVLALHAVVGEEGRRFALRRTAFLPGVREIDEEDDHGAPLAERIERSGQLLVASCLADAPPALLAALRRLLPQTFAAGLDAGALDKSDAACARRWPLVRTLLFKEIAPEWEPCFS